MTACAVRCPRDCWDRRSSTGPPDARSGSRRARRILLASSTSSRSPGGSSSSRGLSMTCRRRRSPRTGRYRSAAPRSSRAGHRGRPLRGARPRRGVGRRPGGGVRRACGRRTPVRPVRPRRADGANAPPRRRGGRPSSTPTLPPSWPPRRRGCASSVFDRLAPLVGVNAPRRPHCGVDTHKDTHTAALSAGVVSVIVGRAVKAWVGKIGTIGGVAPRKPTLSW